MYTVSRHFISWNLTTILTQVDYIMP